MSSNTALLALMSSVHELLRDPNAPAPVAVPHAYDDPNPTVEWTRCPSCGGLAQLVGLETCGCDIDSHPDISPTALALPPPRGASLRVLVSYLLRLWWRRFWRGS